MKTIVTAGLALALIISAAPQARADEADRVATLICTTLSDSPKLATIDGIGLWMVDNGVAVEDAAAFFIHAVEEYCPEHYPLLQRYAALHESAGKLS